MEIVVGMIAGAGLFGLGGVVGWLLSAHRAKEQKESRARARAYDEFP